MPLDAYIATLLEDHDCVIVPDFGGLIANYSPARINAVNNRFDPPFRKISFNKLLVHNDGLLAAYIAGKEQEKYDEALLKVKNYAVCLKSELRQQKRVSIEKVGVLFQQNDGTFRFEQVKNPAFFKAGFGLESFFGSRVEHEPVRLPSEEPKGKGISTEPKATSDEEKGGKVLPITPRREPAKTKASPTKEAIPEQQAHPVNGDRTEAVGEAAGVGNSSGNRRYWSAAAAVLALPILGYAAWLVIGTPLFRDADQFHYSDLNPFTEKVCTEYVVRSKIYDPVPVGVPEPMEIGDDKPFLVLTLDNEPDKTLVVRLTEPVKSTAAAHMLHYHVIGGCFSIESNAHRLVERYRQQGFNPSIVDRKGSLSRVSIASYATKKEAQQALASFQEKIPGAWLLYK